MCETYLKKKVSDPNKKKECWIISFFFKEKNIQYDQLDQLIFFLFFFFITITNIFLCILFEYFLSTTINYLPGG